MTSATQTAEKLSLPVAPEPSVRRLYVEIWLFAIKIQIHVYLFCNVVNSFSLYSTLCQ